MLLSLRHSSWQRLHCQCPKLRLQQNWDVSLHKSDRALQVRLQRQARASLFLHRIEALQCSDQMSFQTTALDVRRLRTSQSGTAT